MNMNTETLSGPEGFSNWTVSWINNSPTGIQNSTKALASTIGSSGTLTNSWRTYITTAICLVLTLPLSLTTGSLPRTVYRSTAYYATYWRAFAVIPGLVFVLSSAFGQYLFSFGVIPSLLCNAVLLLNLYSRLFRA